MLRLLPFVYVATLVFEVVVLATIYALAPPRPSDPLSVWLGTLGLASMVVLLVYAVARRSKAVRHIAELRHWLHFHIFLAFQGFVFVVFHSLPMFTGARFMWLNPGVLNFLAVCVVMASGIFGRWLFQQVEKESMAQRNSGSPRVSFSPERRMKEGRRAGEMTRVISPLGGVAR